MKNIKKHLYLLQLEEYQNNRYLAWLKKNNINNLKENKNQLKWTLRVSLTWLFSLPLTIFTTTTKAVAWTNSLMEKFFNLIGALVILLAKIKLGFYPNTTRIIITGSYGKTTLKEMLAWIISPYRMVLKTPNNINTPLGIAKMILTKLNRQTEVFIIEAGAYQMGDIKKICQLIKPHIGIITIIGLMHLERFDSFTRLKKTKQEIIPFIKEKNRLFLPPKDHHFIDFKTTVSKIAQDLGVSLAQIKQRLASFVWPAHRLEEKIINQQITILDDSYNSNPLGAQKALKKIKSFSKRQKIIVTPGMIEFGKKQYQINFQLGKDIGRITDIAVIIGNTNKKALLAGIRANKRKIKTITLANGQGWLTTIRPHLKPPTAILLENDLPDHYF
ncbi:MAG: Mur ligase family protein [Candidatus Shapirobacteria bacterium]|nr:Mur ligase family protein [Candidatus Shapirobacteria bacterium]